MTDRRRVETRSIPASRRWVVKALRAGRRMTPTHGLVQCDITETLAHLKVSDPPLSVTGFIVAAVAGAAAAHPEVHAYQNWRGRLVIHHHVDVATLVEVATPEGSFPLAHLVRDADTRSLPEISAEIRRIKADPSAGGSGRSLPEDRTLREPDPGCRCALLPNSRQVGTHASHDRYGVGHFGRDVRRWRWLRDRLSDHSDPHRARRRHQQATLGR